MPIKRFLQGQIFDLEHVQVMSDAFSDACNALGLADRDDALAALVAAHIIKLARQGVRSKTALYRASHATTTVEETIAPPADLYQQLTLCRCRLSAPYSEYCDALGKLAAIGCRRHP